MRTLVCALALSACLPLAAQEDQPPASVETRVGGGGPMSLDDARMNFPTVVESFVAARSPHGFWPLKDKASGTWRQLKLVSKEVKQVQAVEGGESLYTGRVFLVDQTTGDQLKADFTVDFSGEEWKVKKMRLIPPPKPIKKPEAPKPAAPPAAATPPSAPAQAPAQPAAQPAQAPAAAPPGPAPAGTPQK